MRIKSLPIVDRPREKLNRYGAGKLKTHELIALLLRNGNRGASVIDIAKKIEKRFAEIDVADVSISNLKGIKGLGPAKTAEILACIELGKRFLQKKKTEILLTPHDIWNRMEDIRIHKKEHFVVFFLDSRNQEIKREVISIGTLNASLVHPREVFEAAIRHSAASVIFAHNHPSGNLEPSDDDIAVTKRLIRAAEILDIHVVDHVIVSASGSSSVLSYL